MIPPSADAPIAVGFIEDIGQSIAAHSAFAGGKHLRPAAVDVLGLEASLLRSPSHLSTLPERLAHPSFKHLSRGATPWSYRERVGSESNMCGMVGMPARCRYDHVRRVANPALCLPGECALEVEEAGGQSVMGLIRAIPWTCSET